MYEQGVNRRQFVKIAGCSVLTLGTAWLSGCFREDEEETQGPELVRLDDILRDPHDYMDGRDIITFAYVELIGGKDYGRIYAARTGGDDPRYVRVEHGVSEKDDQPFPDKEKPVMIEGFIMPNYGANSDKEITMMARRMRYEEPPNRSFL